MYKSWEQDHTHAAAARTTFDTSYQPCAAARSSELSGHLVAPAVAQPRRAMKKHAARPSSRRSSITVVATDVNNFRAMVQELTGFPPAAIFRPLPRRVHAASPFVATAAGPGCGGGLCSDTTGGNGSATDAPVAQPVVAQSPLGVFDGLPDLGSPEFDSWGDLSIE